MKTLRLYEEDSFLTHCTAQVVACTPNEKGTGWWTELDQTVFFPESGGQPCDHGTLGGLPVTQVRERGETVLHLTPTPLKIGATVEGSIDFPRRMELMQQHSGEHLLAAAAFRLFGVGNVGFHLSEEALAVDFDQPLDEEQLHLMEEEANRLVWSELPVKISYLTPEEYATIPMRKKAEALTGRIRMISMGEVEAATCCGTHVTTTGQIGLIKILTGERYKGGTRVHFACGVRALRDYRMKNHTVNTLSATFSVKPEGVLPAIKKQEETLLEQGRLLKSKTTKLLTHLAATLLATATPAGEYRAIRQLRGDLTAEEGKELLTLLIKEPKTAALLWVETPERLLYFFGCSGDCPLDMRPLCRRAGELFCGKGGGTNLLAQGSAPLSPTLTPGMDSLWEELLTTLQSH